MPTEAEWEFAARGPKSLIYPWGDTIDPQKTNLVGTTSLTTVGISYRNLLNHTQEEQSYGIYITPTGVSFIYQF